MSLLWTGSATDRFPEKALTNTTTTQYVIENSDHRPGPGDRRGHRVHV